MKKLSMALGLAALLAMPLQAKQQKSPAGVVTFLSGKVSVFAGDSSGSLKLGQQLYAGDRIKTGANGRLSLVLVDGTQMKVNYNTDMTLNAKDSKGKASERGIGLVKLAIGNLWAKVTKKNARLEFDTPAAVAAVKGTTLDLSVDELKNLCAKLKEGKLDVFNDLGSVTLGELEQVCVSFGKGPGAKSSWDGNDSWQGDMGGASKAVVEMTVVGEDGQPRVIQLEYGK